MWRGFFFAFFWGPRPARQSLAGRRYAAPLAGLLGPAAAVGGLGLALRATAAQRWAARLLCFLYTLCSGPLGPKSNFLGLCIRIKYIGLPPA
ncbi:hypothetical protein SGRA_2788 [Saprospira grandis str. Lewin]|uniref:Uncharacterized protein n=1 Tax=Saprospira grandis (strain Lewin) TaxID=984262 RepID=H6LA48_SAPGL|nr:hypothetical protein SGRA_2788 [Saprospira grandis str. Lewin]